MELLRSGELRKMKSALEEEVQYYLRLKNEDLLHLNPYVGKRIKLSFTGDIFCVGCGKKIKKTFAQGFCYNCFATLPESSPCIIRPELCEAHLGMGRDVEWEEKHHKQPHYVYLALTNAIKVGVTRDRQVPTRWIDQGAAQAILFAEVPYRYLAGKMEIEIKQFVSDKTDWRRMLMDKKDETNDLMATKNMLRSFLPKSLEQYYMPDSELVDLKYPVLQYPEKISTIDLRKTPVIEAALNGIRGQYLFFDRSRAINLRKYEGFHINFEA